MRYNCLFCKTLLKYKHIGIRHCNNCDEKYDNYIRQCYDNCGLYEIFFDINYNEINYHINYKIIMPNNIIAMTINGVDIEDTIIFSKDFETWSDIWMPDQVLAKMPMILTFS